MSTDPALPAVEAEINAYSLLTKPTLELTDDEVEIVVADLQKRRRAYVDENKRDEPHKVPRQKAAPTSAEQKKANLAAIAASLKLDI